MVAKSTYTNVGLPQDLIDQIDKIVKTSKMGYKSRGEFVKEAVRKRIEEIYKNKS